MCKGNLTKQQLKVINEVLRVIDNTQNTIASVNESLDMAARAFDVKGPTRTMRELEKSYTKLDSVSVELYKLMKENE